ncbi:hypothetical protein ACFV1W_32935 [Kitasatospora sp. NPDC059648]|uniref:hypothetical protein n=1 Tax=Kitasatospora sp. NPDC059648 TaxID=3346894 RepID=UPI00369D599B
MVERDERDGQYERDGRDGQRLRRVFEAVLAEALAGRGVATCLGLDQETEEALWAVYDAATGYRAGPETAEELVAAARQAFEGQLDGSNAARWRAQLARKFAERGR